MPAVLEFETSKLRALGDNFPHTPKKGSRPHPAGITANWSDHQSCYLFFGLFRKQSLNILGREFTGVTEQCAFSFSPFTERGGRFFPYLQVKCWEAPRLLLVGVRIFYKMVEWYLSPWLNVCKIIVGISGVSYACKWAEYFSFFLSLFFEGSWHGSSIRKKGQQFVILYIHWITVIQVEQTQESCLLRPTGGCNYYERSAEEPIVLCRKHVNHRNLLRSLPNPQICLVSPNIWKSATTEGIW